MPRIARRLDPPGTDPTPMFELIFPWLAFTLAPAILAAASIRRLGSAGRWALPIAAVAWTASLRALWPGQVSVHEVWWVAAAMLLSAWLSRSSSTWHFARRLGSLLLFLSVAEAGARAAGWSARGGGPPQLAAGPDHWLHCRLDHALRDPADDPGRPRPRVAHLGDSMTEGPMLQRDETFVGRIDRATPNQTHLRVALSGTGPDRALYLLRQLPEIDAAFLHIFPANDAQDLFFPFPWCGEIALLDRVDPDLRSQCPEGGGSLPVHRQLAWDPAPYLQRDLSRYLAIAAAAQQAFWDPLPRWLWIQRSPPPVDEAYALADRVIAAMAAEASDRGIPLYATLLPWSGLRPDASYGRELEDHRARWAHILDRHVVPWLDLTDALSAHTDPPQPGVYLSDDPPDPHLGAAGMAHLQGAMQPWVVQRAHAETPAP